VSKSPAKRLHVQAREEISFALKNLRQIEITMSSEIEDKNKDGIKKKI
jgi:hypothetical protein